MGSYSKKMLVRIVVKDAELGQISSEWRSSKANPAGNSDLRPCPRADLHSALGDLTSCGSRAAYDRAAGRKRIESQCTECGQTRK